MTGPAIKLQTIVSDAEHPLVVTVTQYFPD